MLRVQDLSAIASSGQLADMNGDSRSGFSMDYNRFNDRGLYGILNIFDGRSYLFVRLSKLFEGQLPQENR